MTAISRLGASSNGGRIIVTSTRPIEMFLQANCCISAGIRVNAIFSGPIETHMMQER